MKYRVTNPTSGVLTMTLPLVGFVTIHPKWFYECHDVKNSKGEIEVTAKEIAEGIIRDQMGGPLVLEVIEDEKVVKEVAKESPPVSDSGSDSGSSSEFRTEKRTTLPKDSGEEKELTEGQKLLLEHRTKIQEKANGES